MVTLLILSSLMEAGDLADIEVSFGGQAYQVIFLYCMVTSPILRSLVEEILFR